MSPRLYTYAIITLPMVVTSIPGERLFSKTGAERHKWQQRTGTLPVIFLSLRAWAKEDLKVVTVELVHGQLIRLLSEFFNNVSDDHIEPSDFVHHLHAKIRQLRPIALRDQQARRPFVFNELRRCDHVFVHHDTEHKPVQPPYDRLISMEEKTAKVNIMGTPTTIYRLKLTFSATYTGPNSSTDTANMNLTNALATLPPNKDKWQQTSRLPLMTAQ
ncbi:uncharacterized protein LOC126199075 [Schistocerca nitens]|uniref:uncharacterized protein LOC126199075 n=1 Tax=Schistocerca nitens TaxID=7011 RepID=UPI002118B33D|nr:uncharacterized protein LOC126199075 [Schistocerca nitens]